MPFLLTEGAEPIPGYKLVKKLGVGGYGEVWQATAPGGLAKAIKVIFGATDDVRAEQELKALHRIKEVRHPFLLSLERVEITAGQVFIVMELAEGSLMDRFEECRRAGLPGIPRAELLQHLLDAADALDYMSAQYGLQHLDIKPQNLLLVGRRVKIADFGLVKDLGGAGVTATGGVTPLYASPEAFDGKVSRFSDQYSLAIVYQEMLTGTRPFPGKTTLQLAFQHVNSPPLLDPLPAEDRPTVGRALAKVPDARFPTCRELVDRLREAPRAPAPPTIIPRKYFPAGPADPLSPEGAQSILALDTVIGPVAAGTAVSPATPPPRLQTKPHVGDRFQIRPMLFLGIGGLAARALRRLRRRLANRFGDPGRLPALRFLLLDTDRADLRSGQQGDPGAALAFEDTLLLPLHRPEQYRAKSRDLLQWLDRRWLFGIPRSGLTEGMRSLGRLAFVDHAADVAERLRQTLAQLLDPAARSATAAATGLEVGAGAPRVVLVAGISGGTGGGMAFDVAYAVRDILKEFGFADERPVGLLLHATGQNPTAVELARVNAHASLTELNHYHQGRDGRGKPFEPCYLIHLGDQLDDAGMDAATDVPAEYLYLNAVSAAGAAFDGCRQAEPSSDEAGSAALRTFNLTQIAFPRHAVAAAATPLLALRVVRHWLGVTDPVDEESARSTARGIAADLGLEAEALTDLFHATVKRVLGTDPGTLFGQICAEWDSDPVAQQRKVPMEEVVGQIQARIARHLGGDRGNPSTSLAPTPVETGLTSQSEELAERLSRGTVQRLKALIEDPEWRLSAAAHAVAFLGEYLAGVVEGARALQGQYQDDRTRLHDRLADEWASRGGNWFGIGRRQGEAGHIGPILLELCWLRLKDLVLENVLTVLRGVAVGVSRFEAELGLCREKLTHFADLLETDPASARAAGGLADLVPGRTELFPDQARSRAEAAARLVDDFPADSLVEFDRRFQQEFLGPKGGLWETVAANFNPAEVLRDELEAHARNALLDATGAVNAAELFIDTCDGPAQAEEALETYLHRAVPRLPATPGTLAYVITVPRGPAGDALADLVAKACADFPHTVVRAEEDLRLCAEVTHLPVARAAAALLGPDPGHAEIARQVLTRIDVAWAALPAG